MNIMSKIQGVPFIVSPSKTASSNRKPASAGTFRDRCRAQSLHERDIFSFS